MRKHDLPSFRLGVFLLLVVLLPTPRADPGPEAEGLSAEEFSGMIRDFSEEGGYFFSDNFTSSEDSYLTIVDKLRELGATGGAYIGVGPEQNFTYIAKIKPRIAFIVDIRRQAMIQHLMYKAIFHLAPTRPLFLSYLLSRPIPPGKDPGADASLDAMLELFEPISSDDGTYRKNLDALRTTIESDFKFPLSEEDRSSLEYVYGSFRTMGLDVGFDVGGRRGRSYSRFASLRELLGMKDLKGKQENFLAAKKDYDFVRDMQRRNLVIPVVGDFSGKKALAAVGEYLKKRKMTVSVFYVSNVEVVLFEWGSLQQFSDFVENVRKLPLDEQSLLLRSAFSYTGHPARLAGYQLLSLLQKASVFLRDFDEGRYRTYEDVIFTHYIAPDRP
jgi:hypothetical protein